MWIFMAAFCQEALAFQATGALQKTSSSPEQSRREGRSQFCGRSALVIRKRSRPEEGQSCEPEDPENW